MIHECYGVMDHRVMSLCKVKVTYNQSPNVEPNAGNI
jgi:hypothetical protein